MEIYRLPAGNDTPIEKKQPADESMPSKSTKAAPEIKLARCVPSFYDKLNVLYDLSLRNDNLMGDRSSLVNYLVKNSSLSNSTINKIIPTNSTDKKEAGARSLHRLILEHYLGDVWPMPSYYDPAGKLDNDIDRFKRDVIRLTSKFSFYADGESQSSQLFDALYLTANVVQCDGHKAKFNITGYPLDTGKGASVRFKKINITFNSNIGAGARYFVRGYTPENISTDDYKVECTSGDSGGPSILITLLNSNRESENAVTVSTPELEYLIPVDDSGLTMQIESRELFFSYHKEATSDLDPQSKTEVSDLEKIVNNYMKDRLQYLTSWPENASALRQPFIALRKDYKLQMVHDQ